MATKLPLRGGTTDSLGDHVKLGVLTVSDRASAKVYDDLSGPAVLQFFAEALESSWEAIYKVVPDEKPLIEEALRELVCERLMPGYAEQMRAISLRYVPTAVLSRQTAGLRGKSLILNLPGKPKSIRETIDEVFASVPACIDLLEGPYIVTNEEVVKAFRPANLVRKAKPTV